ncbi:hypothetical protein K525DRAFT_201022 [Schizophyllum commune Loenen D]|nr:hypothetical protein K525DRAFT_201022 [Schizophyllum commune Loenen D]
MRDATCRLCRKDTQFPERWLLYSNCGHASCESCAKGSLSACPICRASTLGRPPIRILGVQVNDVPRLAERDADQRQLEDTIRLLEDKLRLLNEEQQLLQILGMESLLHEMGKMQEWARACATRDGGGPPGAANAPQSSTTVALQHSLINWDEARRLWTRLKDEVIVLTPTWQASGVSEGRTLSTFVCAPIHTMAAQAECCVCLEDVHFPKKWLVFPTCGHGFCEDCAIRSGTACPTCRARRVDQPQTLLRLFNIRLRMPQVASNDEPLRLRVENARLMTETGRLIDELDDAQRRLHGRPAMFYQHAWGTMKIVDAFENIAEDKKVTEAKSIMLCLTMLTAECPVCIESFEFPKDGAFFPACGEVSPRPPVLQVARNAHRYMLTTQPARRIFVQLTGDAEDLASAAGSLGSGSLRSIDPSRVDSVEDYADAEAEKACNALQSLSEWPSLDHDDAAKIVIRDAFAAVQHFRMTHLRLRNHHHRVRADLDLRGERMAALERDNKRLSDLRELSGTMLRASEEIQRRKENELVICRNALKEAKDKVTTLTPKLSRLEREKLERDGDYAKLEAYAKVLTDHKDKLQQASSPRSHRSKYSHTPSPTPEDSGSLARAP